MFDPAIPGQAVRLIDNPAKRGATTGRTQTVRSHLLVEVEFGPNDRQFRRYELLELVPSAETLGDLLTHGRFGAPEDFRKLLTVRKLTGEYTNVFYSMEGSNTIFFPHQFKPVLKFVESTTGHILIADEVGLGKTIEAVYIWKELQTRSQARRLLVVCPSMLREKWKTDLEQKFSIDAEIVDSAKLFEVVRKVHEGKRFESFQCICSLEGIRTRGDDLETYVGNNPRDVLARILEEHSSTEDDAIFDLVIIDEAHYLRNSSTASNHTARRLRDASRHIVLLSATPVQTSSENLYQLLRLLNPERFFDPMAFAELLGVNKHIVTAQRLLLQTRPNLTGARASLLLAEETDYFRNDGLVRAVSDALAKNEELTVDERITYARYLENQSLLAPFITRTRKRDAIEGHVQRYARTIEVRFDPEIERPFYDAISRYLRGQTRGQNTMAVFRLIARQRQMASCLVAAVESWRESGAFDDVYFEDLGLDIEDEDDDVAFTDPDLVGSIDLSLLERHDNKYRELSQFLRKTLAAQPEKIVVFSYFRKTLAYLGRRLARDGVSAVTIVGGMGEAKEEVLSAFRDDPTIHVLLSSEVGSEGIDLQFARMIVNYDLPWNPMRVEQRIGRIDRIGQEAKKIQIINFFRTDTVEDRILQRLYERINIFEESIGDLEDILGTATEELAFKLMDPELTDEEREAIAQQTIQAVETNRQVQNRLEEEAINLVGFTDFIMETIRSSHDAGRWVRGQDMLYLVEDFFRTQYPGAQIERGTEDNTRRLRLPEAAQRDLDAFVRRTHPVTQTNLHIASIPIDCIFDARHQGSNRYNREVIQPTHPLVQWIRAYYEGHPDLLHPCVAISLEVDDGRFAEGNYVFFCHEWELIGFRRRKELVFSVGTVPAGTVLGKLDSEALVTSALFQGSAWTTCTSEVNLAEASAVLKECESSILDSFEEAGEWFERENVAFCDQQATSARSVADRKLSELRSRVERFREQERDTLIPMTEGLIRKVERELAMQIAKVDEFRVPDIRFADVGCGIISVERTAR